MIDVAEVRRRFQQALTVARRAAEERRAAGERAAREFDVFRREVAIPVLRHFSQALRGDGYPFLLATPAETVRLEREGATRDFVELWLDADRQPPQVMARISRTRGGHVVVDEKPVAEQPPAAISDEELVRFLLPEIAALVVR